MEVELDISRTDHSLLNPDGEVIKEYSGEINMTVVCGMVGREGRLDAERPTRKETAVMTR